MSDVSKICPQCGSGNALDTRFCAHCGYDTQSALPMVQGNLPMVLSKAAVPMLAGVAGLALSVGWKLLNGMLNQTARPPLKVERSETAAIQQAAPTPAAHDHDSHLVGHWRFQRRLAARGERTDD
jgi:hypothetical protein